MFHDLAESHQETGRPQQRFKITYDPRLVEESVLLAIRDHAEEGPFREERDRLYEIQEPERREYSFQEFHGTWFVHMRLHAPIEQTLDERPLLRSATRRCMVVPANARANEGAELFVAPPEEGMDDVARRSIGIRLVPDSFLKPAPQLAMLRHEFLHIVDMLDPAFGYEPSWPRLEEPARRGLLQERYRAIWDSTIDGRLVLERRMPVAAREHRFRDFARLFPMLGNQMERAFEQFFSKPCRTHLELATYAAVPEKMLNESARGTYRTASQPSSGSSTLHQQ